MNVLIVSLRGPTNENRRGGAQDYIQYVAAPWVKHGHKVAILCSQEILDNSLLPEHETVDGIEIIRIGSPKHRIIPLVREVHRIAASYTVVIENIMGFPVFLPLALSHSLPLIAIKHHFEGRAFISSQGWIKGMIGLFLEEILQPLFYRSVPFVVVSTKTLADYSNKWIKPTGKVTIIPPGIAPLALNQLAEKYPEPTVIYYGALDTGRKRVDHLISAFREVHDKIPAARLIIGGQGPDSEMLENMAADLPVEFMGFLSEVKKCELLERGWVFASPSMTEGFGITWVEANSAGMPVVGYDLGLDTVNEKCSIMVPVGDVHELASALISLLSNHELRNNMAAAARENARRFDWKESNRKLTEFIDDVCSSHK